MIGRRDLLLAAAAIGASGLATPVPARAGQGLPDGVANTTGGRGGRILKVTTLAAAGPGSLREALEADGPRVVVFEVGGIIDLGGQTLRLRNPRLTLAGQTAPDPGITLIRGGLEVATHDVVIRHIRVRPGAESAAAQDGRRVDGLSARAARNLIVDQCSFSWATGENLSVLGPGPGGGDPAPGRRRHAARRLTFSRNIIAEGLSGSRSGEASHGTLIRDGAAEVLIVGNLYVHNRRSLGFRDGVRAAAVNNLIHDPGDGCMDHAFAPGRAARGGLAVIGNVTRGGRSTGRDLPFLRVEGHGRLDLHAVDNPARHIDGREIQALETHPDHDLQIMRPDVPPAWLEGFAARPSSEVEAWVRAEAGARPWARDAVDRRLLEEARTGWGQVIDDEKEVGGPPTATGTRRPFDPAAWTF